MCLFTTTQSFIDLELWRRLVRVHWTSVDRHVSIIIITRLLLLLSHVIRHYLLVVEQVASGAVVVWL